MVVDDDGSNGISWSRDAAHSGKRSIRLEADAHSQWVKLAPTGAVCNVKPQTRYRLSGWIRTKGVERFARIQLYSYEYTYGNVIDTACSAKVSGTRDWVRVVVELDSGDEAYLMPEIAHYGPGTAWFDDLCLQEAGD